MFSPNIDEQGAQKRTRGGLIFLAIAGILGLLGVWLSPSHQWIFLISIGFALIGLWGLFAGHKRWCAARACGIKTPY